MSAAHDDPARSASPRLQSRVVVVTGGTRGIGAAVVRRCARDGARVVALSRSGVGDAESLGVVEVLACDVGDETAVATAFTGIAERLGPVEVLVNNAGVSGGRMIHRDELANYEYAIRVNLIGTWLCTRAALLQMRAAGRGSIVNVASMSARLGNIGQGAYSATKAGVVTLTKTTAREGAPLGIRANAVCPGLIRTDMTGAMPGAAWDRMLETISLGRPGEPEEVANVVAFLASDEASYVTGVAIDVAGGRGM